MRTICILTILTVTIGAASFRQTPVLPKVTIVQPKDRQELAWNSQVRYEIGISDAADGDSKYGEITSAQVLMEVTFIPGAATNAAIKKEQERKSPPGLAVMRSSTCFGCHSDKVKTAGPSFEDLAKKYQPTPAVLKTLASHVINGSHGVWGTALDMPGHPDLTPEQAMQAASYMIGEGKDHNRWIYSGLEGLIRIKEKPAGAATGAYVLTASYTSKAVVRGQQSIVLKIK